MQVILDSLIARPGSAPKWGGKKGEFRDWTSCLPGVAVYLDDILVSGSTAQEHLNNLKRLLQRLSDKGLRCRLEKCLFAQPYVEYLGHLLSSRGVAKSPKVHAVQKMPAPRLFPVYAHFLVQSNSTASSCPICPHIWNPCTT